MRGQTKNAVQQATVARLLAKGWREGSMFALAVTMYYDRPFVGLPCPHVIHVRRDGRCYRGYPGHSSVASRTAAAPVDRPSPPPGTVPGGFPFSKEHPVALRKFTLAELVAFSLAAARVRDEIDRELGEALLRVAGGDDSALAECHERLNVLGRFEDADRIRELVARAAR